MAALTKTSSRYAPMTDEIGDSFDTDEEQEVCLEPLPPFADEQTYLETASRLPVPGDEQIRDFVQYVAGAKSWYKHLPARPPGSPMHFYLDPNAGRDRLRRWGHEVIYRDRTEHTEKFHYTWMTTEEYRRRFGYLAFCCPDVTRVFTTEMIEDGIATLDPNVLAPLVEGEHGRLALVPEVVLGAGACFVTRTVHARTDAASLWRKWNKTGYCGDNAQPLSGVWPRIADLCVELGREAPGVQEYLRTRPYPLPPLTPDSYPADKEEGVKQVKALESELNALIRSQGEQDHREMQFAIENMLEFVQRSVGRVN